ncbi:hypothetical protein ABFS83_14G205500 [Erythranthe nasuta]
MGLRDIGHTLPPGFRFYPSDEELVCHYLYRKVIAAANEEVVRNTLVEIDLHTCEPWQLPDVAKLNSEQWYFFSFRDRKYATGCRANRATTSGYWKATGKDRAVVDPANRAAIVGMRKTLVFYKNRAPNGLKTGWVMHEFRLQNSHVPMPPYKEDWVLCRVFHKTSSAENSNKLQISPHNNIYDDSTPNLDYYSLPTINTNQNTITTSTHHQQQYNEEGQNPRSNSSLALSEVDPARHFVETSKCEDGIYGFDTSFFDYTNGVPSNSILDAMRFDYDNCSVFI